ncbi:MAG: signal recognition particle receptor subunit alpha [Myxococcota bacterium]
MFEAVKRGFRAARHRLQGKRELTEHHIEEALRDIRRSLLEADVEYGVVKQFMAQVREQALGRVVRVKGRSGEWVSPSVISSPSAVMRWRR